MIDMDYLKHNVSTIAVMVYGVLSPYLAQYLSADEFSALALAVVSIVIALYSASHPNTFKCLGNCNTNDCSCKETVMNDEYVVDPTGDDS